MARFYFIIGLLFIITACAGTVAKVSYPVAMTSEIKQAWDNAESLMVAKKYSEADAAYQNFIQNYGYNALTDNAYFSRGEIAFSEDRFERATEYYKLAYANVYSPSVAPKAQFKAAYSLYNLGRFDEALQELLKITRRDASAVLCTRADSLAISASQKAGKQPNEAIRWYLFLLDDYEGLGANLESVKKISNIISQENAMNVVKKWVGDNNVTVSQVEELPLKEYKGKLSGGYAAFKLGKVLNREGSFDRANKELKAYMFAYPKHEYYAEARSLLTETSKRAGDVSTKIGVIVPLSGKYTVYGESVLHGIECAAGVFEPCRVNGNVQLVVRDCGGDAAKATAAVSELAGQGVSAIIGPLVSATAPDAVKKAQELGVPIISLSQREGLLNVGDFVFRNTVTSKSQVETIANYAIKQKKLKQFLVLYPKSEQGREYKELFSSIAADKGGRVVTSHGYSANPVEFASELRTMPIKEEGVSYSAIFIPDSFALVGYLVPALATMGIEGIPLFGISRWDDPKLVTLGGKYVEGAVFPEAFYKKADSPEVREFVVNFREVYAIEPTLLEALGYDSMKMILKVLESGAVNRDVIRSNLAQLKDFNGVTGKISFDDNRDAARELPLLTVKSGEIVELTK